MGLTVIVSNYLVQFPVKYFDLSELLTYGAFTYPITFLITDLANRVFGKTIAYDNGWLAISAIYDAQYGYKSGAVYLFYFDGVNWVEHSKITAFDATAYDRFGYSIDIDNNRLVVGSIYDDDSGDNSGSVYLYDLINNSWI